MEDTSQPEENHEHNPVSKEQAQEAEKQAKAAGSALLDNIESTRREQGDYFYEVGKTTNIEKPNQGESDPRIIVFKTSIDIDGKPTAVAITQDGAFTINSGRRIEPKYTGPPVSSYEPLNSEELFKRLEELGKYANSDVIRYVPSQEDKSAELFTSYGSHENMVWFQMDPISDLDTILKARDESIRNTETPHKARLETAQAKTQLINGLTQSMSQLPPRE